MKLSANTDFFKKQGPVSTVRSSSGNGAESNSMATKAEGGNTSQQKDATAKADGKAETSHKIKAGRETAELITSAAAVLKECGFSKLASQTQHILIEAVRDRFTVSVVGEFSHGKSTFLNNMLNNAAHLPTADLPTTAILTRIRYASKPSMAIFDDKGTRKATLSIKPEAWDGLVADNFSETQPKGSVIVGIPDPWLGRNNIEIIDSPGAGDLSEERAQVVGDVLNRTDGAIIALTATAALSNSEKLFIQNRILSRKTPYTLIIVTKMDLVPKAQRNGIIKYILNVLKLNKMDIPVFVPANIDMPDDTYKNIIGMDKVKAEVNRWVHDPERQHLMDTWARSRAKDYIGMALTTLDEKQKLLSLDDEKRRDAIRQKRQALGKIELEWGEMTLQLQKKGNECYSVFNEKVKEYTGTVTERLQFEASHAGNPEKWWREDYPYRLKVELANISVGLDNVVARIIAKDANDFNHALNEKFKAFVQIGSVSIAGKQEYESFTSTHNMTFSDLNKQQNLARVGTVAISLALAPFFGIFATMGVGTAGTLITNALFKNKIEEQRQALKKAIAQDVPEVIFKATANSQKRINILYDDMLAETAKKKDAWLEAQTKAIENEGADNLKKEQDGINATIDTLNAIRQKL